MRNRRARLLDPVAARQRAVADHSPPSHYETPRLFPLCRSRACRRPDAPGRHDPARILALVGRAGWRGSALLTPYPQIVEYNEAVQHPATAFRDPELRRGQIKVNAL